MTFSIKLVVEEMVASFTTGDANIESEWDAYLGELENLELTGILNYANCI